MSVAVSPIADLTRWLPVLDPTCLRLLLLFISQGDAVKDGANDPADGPGAGAVLSMIQIAEAIGQNRRTCRQHIGHLQDADLLDIRTRYYYCDCDCSGDPCMGGCCGECGTSNTRAANAYRVNMDVLEEGPS